MDQGVSKFLHLFFLNANFMRRFLGLLKALGFEAGNPLGEDSVKSQTEK